MPPNHNNPYLFSGPTGVVGPDDVSPSFTAGHSLTTNHLPERERPRIRRKLQKAYDCDTYEEAKAALESLKPELKLMNQSAVTSLEEGLEETLTLHRLGMLPFLKRSFRTTNCIEALNSMAGELTRKVRRWNNSPQRHNRTRPHPATGGTTPRRCGRELVRSLSSAMSAHHRQLRRNTRKRLLNWTPECKERIKPKGFLSGWRACL